MFKLIIEDDEGKTTVVPITRDEITVGRKEGNNIRLTERNVSRQHARLTRQNGSVFIEDLDSYNGVRINGDRIQVKTPVTVNVGDLIEIGDYHLAIQLEGVDEPGLATRNDEESTQRVAMQQLTEGTEPGSSTEVTSRVAMPPSAPEPTQPGWAPSAHRSGPSPALEHTPDPEAPARRVEPTAIVRTSDLAPPPAAEEGARLVVVSTHLAGKVIPLKKAETVLGRTEDNDVQVDHRSVSRNHAKIVREGERYSVVDLGSANGVLVNGEEYKKIDLRRGDIIELGHVKLRFVDAGDKFQLTAEEIEKLRAEEPADDGFAANDPTGVLTGRVGRAAGGAKPFPVKVVAGVAGGVAVLALILVMALGKGTSSGGTTTPPVKDPVAGTSSGATADPPTSERPPPRKDPDRPPEKKPPPTTTTSGGDERLNDRDKVLRAADAAMRAEEWPRARELVEKLAASDGEARKLLERVDREMKGRGQLDDALDARGRGDLDRAWRLLQQVLDGTRARVKADAEAKTLKPQLVQKHLKNAESALQSGNLDEAQAEVEDALHLDSGNREANKLKDKIERARSTRRPGPQATPTRPAPDNSGNKAAEARKAVEDCNKAILLGNFDDAVSKCKSALKLDPAQTDVHKLLGVAYARQGKYCDAKFHYKKFIDLNPNSATVDRIKQILAGQELQACP